MVITGLEHVHDAEIAVKKLLKKIKKFGIKISEPEITIQNMVASGDLHTLIDLNKAILLMDYAMYEPEVFPGLIYRMENPNVVFLLFATGKMVCVGAKREKDIQEAVQKLLSEIVELGLSENV